MALFPPVINRNTSSFGIYGDGRCTVPLISQAASLTACDSPMPSVVKRGGETCTTGASFYELIDYEPSTEPFSSTRPALGCRAVPVTDGSIVKKIGKLIEPAAFATASAVTE